MFTTWMNLEDFSDIHFAQVKFPDFSPICLKIPWLSRISQNSLTFPWLFSSDTKFPDFFRFPEIPGLLATLLILKLLWNFVHCLSKKIKLLQCYILISFKNSRLDAPLQWERRLIYKNELFKKKNILNILFMILNRRVLKK